MSTDKRTPAVLRRLEVLKLRRDFVAASHGRRFGASSLHLQARARGDDLPPRVGFTCSKKVGNAVARNRAKRRLRALANAVLADQARDGWDYVLVGRAGVTATAPFSTLETDLNRALAAVHQ